MQGYIADSYAELEQFRLLVLYTAWEIDKYKDYKRVRKDIATIKVVMPKVVHDIAWRSMHVHGALGVSNEMPFFGDDPRRRVMGLVDGPTEVHKMTVAKQVLRDYRPTEGMWPSEWIPGKQEAAQARSSPSTSNTRSGTFDRSVDRVAMKAAMCRAYGPPEAVQVEDVPGPTLEAGRVRVHVRAAAVNFPDVLVVADKYQVTAPLPFVPGSELAGVVTEVADDVDWPAVGDRVFGTAFVGAFAEEAVLPAASVTHTPSTVDDAHAAAFGVASRTAYHVLRSVAGLAPVKSSSCSEPEEGSATPQCRWAWLSAPRSRRSRALRRSWRWRSACGASRLIDRTSGDLRQALRGALPRGADVVIDMVGGDQSEPALRTLHWGGRFVTVGYASGRSHASR